MISDTKPSAKRCSDKFAKPPWDQNSPQWQAADQQLPPDHLARLIEQGVNQLDLTPLLQSFAGRGSKACRPDLMLKIVLFEIQRGRPSPAQWYLDTHENLAVQWLGMGIRPARSVWYQFAFRLRPYVDQWLGQVLQQAQQDGHTSAERVALDGTTVEAHASRHRLLNGEQVQQRHQRLQEAIADDEQGTQEARRPYWMAKTATTRKRQQQQYRRAQTALAERVAENQQRPPSRRQDDQDIRISVTDPEAALGKDKHKVYRPLYNVQYVRDLDSPFILAYDVFARSSDVGTLVPMMARLKQLTGRLPQEALVDSGYVTALDLADAYELGVQLYGPWRENDYAAKEPSSAKLFSKDQFLWDEQSQHYICPQGQPLPLRSVQNRKRCQGRLERVEQYQAEASGCAACPVKERCCPKSKSGRHVNRSEHEELIVAHRSRMATPQAKELYKRRRQTVETSIGDAKEHRRFRRVNGRGLWKAKIQAGLTVLAHNLKELVKAAWNLNSPQKGT